MLIKWIVPVIMLICAFCIGVVLGMIEKDLFGEEDYDSRR